MASRRRIFIKLCLFLHILEVLLGSVLSVFSFLLQTAAEVGLAETPSWLGIPCALFGLIGISIIILNKLKEELVFVLAFHGLVIGLCVISLILITPKVSRWQPVSSFQAAGICNQSEDACNCTKPLPSKVFRCADLLGIYDLSVIISVFIGLCLANYVLAAYFDFLIMQRYVPQDNAVQSSTLGDRHFYEDEQFVYSFGEIRHIGPVNSPELEPSICNDILNPGLLNRSERLISIEEKELEAQGDKMGSSSSMPAAKQDVEDKTMEKVKEAANANGSRQSVKLRKDNLLPHQTPMQATDVNITGNENDENSLNDLEIVSNPYINQRTGSVDSIRTSPRIIQGIDSSNSNANGIANKGDTVPTGIISKSIAFENTGSDMMNRNHKGIMEISKRCYSDVTLLANSLEKAKNNSRETSKRSQSQRDLPELANPKDRLPNVEATARLPEYATEKVINKLFVDQINSSGFEGSSRAHKDVFDQRISTPPSRRTGYANKTFHGLPPLPLKECKCDLSVQERTFSAPTLPFVDSFEHKHGSSQVKQRPGSSGSQIVADRKKQFTSQVRNELIDKEALLHDSKLTPFQKEIDADELHNNRRRNSFDTFSTDIEIEENVDESEVSEDLGKKPRWHPPWQLKQEIIAHKDSIPILAIEPRNRWFASGSADRTMKIWDINNGNCRLTVKVHKAGIRALAFGSTGHRFIFSAADDRQLICTDIEVNKIVAHYPDQSSVIYGMAMYRPAELLVTCGRDKYVKIWDTREKKCVKTMRGHMNTASSLAIIQSSGQIVSGSHDSTMRIWDIGEGRCTQILTGHEKSVRSIYVHPEEPVISSSSTERIIHWSMPDGEKIKEITPTDISINCISVNPQGALVAAGSNGVIHLWDWKSGHKFQKIHRTSVYESQEVPICVFSVAFDKSGSRLFVSDASNIIKVYGEAYTRVRRRHGNIEDKETKTDKHSKFPTPDYAFS